MWGAGAVLGAVMGAVLGAVLGVTLGAVMGITLGAVLGTIVLGATVNLGFLYVTFGSPHKIVGVSPFG